MTWGERMFDHYQALDRALVARGFPATSQWWMGTLKMFFASGCRKLVLRVGRRGGKSSTLCRVAVCLALYGEHIVNPGDIGVCAFVSVSRDEASQRIRTIAAILRTIGVSTKPTENGIEMTDRPICWKVFAASVASVSGFTAIAVFMDECAKMRTGDGVNCSEEVRASVEPTMATQPNARIFLSSSPFGPSDMHARAFDEADGVDSLAAHAATWQANPSVSEEQTHRLERDPRIHAREYAAIPQQAAMAAFDEVEIVRAFEPRQLPASAEQGAPVLVLDPSSGRNDAFTFAIAYWVLPSTIAYRTKQIYDGNGIWLTDFERDEAGNLIRLADNELQSPVLRVTSIGSFGGKDLSQRMPMHAIVEHISNIGAQYGAVRAIGDQREAYSLQSLFQPYGEYVSLAWTNPGKVAAVETLRDWLREGTLWLDDDASLRSQLLGFEEKITPSNQLTYGARTGKHDDFVALLLTLALAEREGLVPTSPMQIETVTRSLPAGYVA